MCLKPVADSLWLADTFIEAWTLLIPDLKENFVQENLNSGPPQLLWDFWQQ